MGLIKKAKAILKIDDKEVATSTGPIIVKFDVPIPQTNVVPILEFDNLRPKAVAIIKAIRSQVPVRIVDCRLKGSSFEVLGDAVWIVICRSQLMEFDRQLGPEAMPFTILHEYGHFMDYNKRRHIFEKAFADPMSYYTNITLRHDLELQANIHAIQMASHFGVPLSQSFFQTMKSGLKSHGIDTDRINRFWEQQTGKRRAA